MNTFSLKIYASNKVFYEGEAISLTLPTIDGEMGILANHEDMIIGIEVGELRMTTPDEKVTIAAVSQGFAEIIGNEVNVLVSTAELPEEIDIRRAEEAAERAEEHLRQKKSIQEYYSSQASLARSMNRLKLSKNRGRKI